MTWEWKDHITTIGTVTLQTEKHNKMDLLPLTTDLVKLNEQLHADIAKHCEILKDVQQRSRYNWMSLANPTLALITLFNKRRGSEVSMMRLKSYTERPDWRKHANKEIVDSFSESEKTMSDW